MLPSLVLFHVYIYRAYVLVLVYTYITQITYSLVLFPILHTQLF
jgi:hypothetical protein